MLFSMRTPWMHDISKDEYDVLSKTSRQHRLQMDVKNVISALSTTENPKFY